MTQAAFTSIPSNVDSLLRRATQRLLVVAAGWSLARVLAVVLAAALVMLLLDAALHFAAWVRITLDAVFLALLLGSAVYVFRALRACRYDPHRAAVLVEKRLGLDASQLINAVQLSTGAGQHQSPALVRASIADGDALAKTLEPGKVADTAPLKRALRNLAVVVAVMLIVLLAAPGIYQAGIPRYVFPADPNPPFTTLGFDVSIEPEQVRFGHPATIQARITGPNAPSQASVVFVDDDNQPEQRAPMRRAGVGEQTGTASTAANDHSAFALTLDRAEQTRRFYIETPGGRSKLFTLEVLPVPEFDEVSVFYDYPRYTGWAGDTRVLDAEGIRVLAGTTATLTVTSNIPLSGGTLTVDLNNGNDQDPQPIPPTDYKLVPRSDDPRIADVAIPIRGNARFSITLKAEDGTPSNDPLIGSITAIPDARPDVNITDPPATVVVPENHTVEVKIKAVDDVGISRVLLTRSVNRWGSSTIKLPTEFLSVDKASAGATYQFELARLGVEPGDVITYFATAYDNRAEPNGLNQSADSEVHVIQVISVDEYLEYERTKYRIDDINEEFDDITEQLNELAEMREQLLEEMKPLLEKLQNGEELSPEDMKRLEELQKQLEAFEEAARALREKLEERAETPELYEFEKPYTDMLKELAEDLKEQEEQANAARQALAELQQAENQARQGQPNEGEPREGEPREGQPREGEPREGEPREQPQGNNLPSARRSAQVRLEAFIGEQNQDGGNTPFGEQMMKQMELTKEQLKQLELADRLAAQLDRLAAIIEAERELEQRLSSFENKEELDAAEQLRAAELGAEQAEIRRELVDTMQEMEKAAKDAQKLLPIMSASALDIVQKVQDLAIVRDMKDAGRLAEAGEGRTAHTAADSAADKLESLISACKNCKPGPGMGQIDGPLRLTPEQLQQALQQMAQGRGLPGMNPGRNQGPGYGMGSAGSRAPMAVRGPNARPDDRGRQGRRNGRAGQASAGAELDSADESINAGTDTGRDASAGYIVGVPQRYRDEAAAYFRRIADENK